MASPSSLPGMFLERVRLTPDAAAYRFRDAAGWATMSWRQVETRVRAIAGGLAALGIARGDRCGILCSTRVEWGLVDLGILCAGAATTTVYPASKPDDCAYILADSGCRMVFVEDADQLAKIVGQRAAMPELEHAVLIDGAAPGDGFVLTLGELEAKGRELAAREPARFEVTVAAVLREDLATLIYTSGTTGRPKGVELTHDAWVFEAEAIEALEIFRPGDHSLLWLPLAHVFGKVLLAAQLKIGIPSAVDGKIERLGENLAAIRPTLMAGVPRVYEKMYNAIVEGAKAGGAAKYRAFQWALAIGRERAQCDLAGEKPGLLLALRHALADRLVLAPVRAKFGGNLRFFSSGSAPLSAAIGEFFHAIGIPILEGYGLTESSAASFLNRLGETRYGTVGKPLPGVTVKIAEDGEILIGGRGIMRGYWNQAEASAAVLKDGWLATGDIGHLDRDGYLVITDRKKDLIKTSGGKYVAPQNLEGRLRLACPLLGHVLVHGEGRNFCTALVTLDADGCARWARARAIAAPADGDWTRVPAVREQVTQAFAELNRGLASFETLKAFEILSGDFTVAGGELTTSMKVRRRVVEEKYRALLDRFYDGTLASL